MTMLAIPIELLGKIKFDQRNGDSRTEIELSVAENHVFKK